MFLVSPKDIDLATEDFRSSHSIVPMQSPMSILNMTLLSRILSVTHMHDWDLDWMQYPEAPRTQYLRTLVPKTIPLMVFGTKGLQNIGFLDALGYMVAILRYSWSLSMR